MQKLVGPHSDLLSEVACFLCAWLLVSLDYFFLGCDIKIFGFSAEALSRLDFVIRHSNARDADNVMAYDNAVSALGKICQFHRDTIDAVQVCTAFLGACIHRVCPSF